MISLDALRKRSAAELEALFAIERPLTDRPRGLWRGHVLGRLDTPGARRPFDHALQHLFFVTTPWGIDFDRDRWFFLGRRRLAAGHFELRAQRSRWRDTTSWGLHYQPSRLPRAIRRLLYDEVKPLEDGWLIGIGGTNEERDQGDHFWMVLDRMR